MPTYIQKALKCFQHPPPRILQDQPHPNIKKTYDAKEKFAKPIDKTPLLDKAGKKLILARVLLFWAQAIDGTMLTPLSALASKQAAPTEATMEKCLQFHDYVAS
jgi:hypothetical protein